MNTFIFEFGDWSGDGHAMTNTKIISSDLTSEEFEEYLDKIYETLGFDLKNICNDYEDNVLPDDLINYLKETNFDFENAEIDIEESPVTCYDRGFLMIILHLIKKCYQQINQKDIVIEINEDFPKVVKWLGYGCFLV